MITNSADDKNINTVDDKKEEERAKNMKRELRPVTKYLDWIGLRLKTDQLTIQLHFSSFTK